MADRKKNAGSGSSSDADLLLELEQQCIQEIRAQRSHVRLEVKVAVELRPANSSARDAPAVRGVTSDVSRGGCRAVFTAPVHVGDVYRLEFAREELDVSTVFARCMRCRFLSEDAFEVGFRFFTDVDLPAGLSGSEAPKDLLS